MKYKIIKTDDYLLVVDDSEIKEGDYRVNIQRGYFKKVDKEGLQYYNKKNDVFKKVIAHLPLNNSPILQGVDLLPPLEEETDVDMSLKGALEPKQETIEEAAEKYAKQFDYAEDFPPQLDFIEGAKSDAAKNYWFNQFKKK